MADVFISYKSERRAAAEHLAEVLADYGYTVWWDYGLISGRDFGRQIESELRAAKAVIVLWCSLAVESDWVREEATLAKELSKIIPTKIEAVSLPLGFSLAQTLDLSTWDGAPQGGKLDRLVRDIAHLVGRPPHPNYDGLERTERAWRRFGAPPLREFALIDALEPNTARTLPSTLAPARPAPQPAMAAQPASPPVTPTPKPASLAVEPSSSTPSAGGGGTRLKAIVLATPIVWMLTLATIFFSVAVKDHRDDLGLLFKEMFLHARAATPILFVAVLTVVSLASRYAVRRARPQWRSFTHTLLALAPALLVLTAMIITYPSDIVPLVGIFIAFALYMHGVTSLTAR